MQHTEQLRRLWFSDNIEDFPSENPDPTWCLLRRYHWEDNANRHFRKSCHAISACAFSRDFVVGHP